MKSFTLSWLFSFYIMLAIRIKTANNRVLRPFALVNLKDHLMESLEDIFKMLNSVTDVKDDCWPNACRLCCWPYVGPSAFFAVGSMLAEHWANSESLPTLDQRWPNADWQRWPNAVCAIWVVPWLQKKCKN